MKFTLLFILFVSIANTGVAKIHTVSNDPNRPAQFNEVDPAIAAAAAGDTIYVYGSLTNYNSCTLNKKLILIGAGYNTNNQFKYRTVVNSILINSSLQSADGSIITGIETGSINSGSPVAKNVVLFRNRISGITLTNATDGWIIYNNIITGGINGGNNFGPTSPSATNTIIQNNIIKNVSLFSASSTLIDHNIFYGPNNLSAIWNTTITNNIFIRSSGNIMDGQLSFNSFSNNISNQNTLGPVAPTNSFSSNQNTDSGNLVGIDPQFENVTNLDNFDYNFNYRLRTTSPARNAGTNGTDLGIYAPPYPFPTGGAAGSGFDTSALPAIPQITEMTIQNATVQPGAPLNVNVKARVNN